jgi:hypothetical protein
VPSMAASRCETKQGMGGYRGFGGESVPGYHSADRLSIHRARRRTMMVESLAIGASRAFEASGTRLFK